MNKVTPETYIRAESDRQFGVVAPNDRRCELLLSFPPSHPSRSTECRADEQGHALLNGRCGYIARCHDDSEREYAYDAGAEKVQQLAAEHNWQVISMQKDFHQVFAFE